MEIYSVFVFLRKFGCLMLFHDVPHCFSYCLSFQVVGQFRSVYVVLFVVFFHVGQLLELMFSVLCLVILVRFQLF